MFRSTLAVFLTAGFLSGTEAQLSGTWELNFDLSPHAVPTVSRFVREGDFLRNTNGEMNYRFKVDGQTYPVSGSATADAAVWKMIGRGTFQHDALKGGKVVYTVTSTVYSDNKVRSYTHTRTMPDGSTRSYSTLQDRVGGRIDPEELLVGEWRQRPRLEIDLAASGEVRVKEGLSSYSARLDGRDYPVAGSTSREMVSLVRQDARTVVETSKKGGTEVSVAYWVVGPDDKTLFVSRQRFDGPRGLRLTVWKRSR